MELLELLNEFQTDVRKDFLNTVQELELVDVYLIKEFIENKPIMTKIQVRRKLEGSIILKSK